MKKKMVAIGIFADRLDLLVVQGGRVTASRRLPVTFEFTAEGWSGSLRKAGPALGDTVRELKLTGWPTVVLYANPTASAEYVSVKASTAAEAREAAVLTIGDSLGYPLALAVASAALIAADSAGDEPEKHLVVTADRDDQAMALADMIQDAGLKLWSATPMDAAIMMKVAREGLSWTEVRSQRSEVRSQKSEVSGRGSAPLTSDLCPVTSVGSAHLYVGEQRSFFVVIENGTVAFARPIGLGIQMLATSLTRPMRVSSEGRGQKSEVSGQGSAPLTSDLCPLTSVGSSEPIELDQHTAHTVLRRFGFPDRATPIDGPGCEAARGLTGAQIIPLLQPVLQRFVVELRQSLRFGLSEQVRQSITINFSGPGSGIPGFAGVLAGELRLAVEVDPRYASFDGATVAAATSELMEAIGDQGVLTRLNLQPRELAQARQINRLQRWVWTGAAMALALVGFDAMNSQAKLRSLEIQAQTEAARSTESQSVAAATQKMLAGIEAMTSLDNTIASQVGAQVNFRACMQEIASLVPATIRLTEIRFNQNDNKTTGSVLGYAFPEGHGGGGRKSDLETFISRLTESPLFDKVALGNVQVAAVSSRSAQQFEVGVTGVAVATEDRLSAVSTRVAVATGGPKAESGPLAAPVSAQVQAQEGVPR